MNSANLRGTKFYKGLDNFTAISIAEGFAEGEHTKIEILCAWQFIVDAKLLGSLQGWFGRTAVSLIEDGLIRNAK